MNEIEIYTSDNLPSNIEDLSKFVLFGREKLASVRAEIRAIDKLELATEIRNQKMKEGQALNEALIDAEVKLGELMAAMEKRQGFANDKSNIYNTSQCCNELNECEEGINSNNIKTKTEQIKELGFSKDQFYRFEQLAKNKDIVEEVKQEARENGEFASRTKILNLVQARKQAQEKQIDDYHDYCKRLDRGHKTHNKFLDAVSLILTLNGETLEDMLLGSDEVIFSTILDYLNRLGKATERLKLEVNKYKNERKKKDGKNFNIRT